MTNEARNTDYMYQICFYHYNNPKLYKNITSNRYNVVYTTNVPYWWSQVSIIDQADNTRPLSVLTVVKLMA